MGLLPPGKAQNGAGNKRPDAIIMDNIPLFERPASNSGHVGHRVTALNSWKTLGHELQGGNVKTQLIQ